MNVNLGDMAPSLLGVKFRANGRNPIRGLDCVGVLVVTCQLAGVNCPDFNEYGMAGSHDLLILQLHAHGFKKQTRNPRKGDVVTFKGKDSGHVGIMESETSMIHSRVELGEVRREPFAIKWAKILSGVWEPPN